MLTSRGLGAVLGDLAALGFDAKWGVLGAADIGAPHQRDRIWIRAEQMGYTYNNGQTSSQISPSPTQRSNSSPTQQEQTCQSERSGEQYAYVANTSSQRGQAGSTDSQGGQERHSNESQHSSSDLAYAEDKGDVWRKWELGFVEQKHNNRRGSTNGSREWWSAEPNVG